MREIVFLLTLVFFGGCTYLTHKLGLPEDPEIDHMIDEVIEEVIEDVIEEEIGINILPPP